MEENIGFCGYNCHLCAARSDDRAERQKLVDGWKRIFGHQVYTADNVRCDGCRAGKRLADKQCKARPCAVERKVESCADCSEFPCDRVRNLLGDRNGLLIHCCRDKKVTEEEYNRCCRQFEGMPNLVRRMAERGRLDRAFVEGRK